MKIRYVATSLFLMVALTAGLARGTVWASDNRTDQERPIRLYASARFGPIGAIKMAFVSGGAVAIDGRIARGEELIWGGELIKVLSDRKAQVTLDSIGEITLARGGAVRCTTARGEFNESSHQVLVASLVEGSIDVKLNG